MFKITGTLRVLPLLVVLSYPPVCSGWDVDASRLSLKPVYYQKSCRDGMVAYQDYFVMKGLINISNLPGGENGMASIFFVNRWTSYNSWIFETSVWLKGLTCQDLNIVKINSCNCTFRDSNYVRVMCNLTAKTVYSRMPMHLHLGNRGKSIYSNSFYLPPIYGTPVCIGSAVNQAAKSHPGSFSAVLGTALLGTAAVCLVSSIISHM